MLCLQSNASGSFLQKCINFEEQRLNFSHFEGSTFLISHMRVSSNVKDEIFDILSACEDKKSADFQICISVPQGTVLLHKNLKMK